MANNTSWIQYMPQFKIVEVNKSVALLSGDMVADYPILEATAASANLFTSIAFANDATKSVKYLENGKFLTLTATTTPEFTAATGTADSLWLHYTEENYVGPLMNHGSFAVQVVDEDTNGKAIVIPRALRLYPGDSYTISFKHSNVGTNHTLFIIGSNGEVASTATVTSGQHYFVGKKTYHAAGEEALELHYMGRK